MNKLKRASALVISSLLAVCMGITAFQPMNVFAKEGYRIDLTAADVQNDRVYINGDEIRAFQVGETFYLYADDLAAYGFAVDTSKNPATVQWAGTDYYYDLNFTPNVDEIGTTKGTEAKEAGTVQIGDETAALYDVDGVKCIKAEDMDAVGYHAYDAEKNLMNIYVEAAGYTQNEEGYRNITVDAGNVTSKINSMSGHHRNPGAPDSQLSKIYTELGIDSIRTHDAVGDNRDIYIPMLAHARNEADNTAIINWDPDDYDPTDWKNYDFSKTDAMIDNILAQGSEVYFRFGDAHFTDSVPPNREDWPKYLNTYVEIAKKIIQYYQFGEGNNGKYDHALAYFEFWNEPDLTDFWDGPNPDDPEDTWSREIFYDYYAKVVTAVKALDPDLPVGGVALTTQNDYRGYEDGFIKYLADNNVPMDFYTFHYYPSNNSDPYDFARLAMRQAAIMEKYGLDVKPMHITEWDMSHQGRDVSEKGGAFVAAAMMYMQDSPVTKSHIYYNMLMSTNRETGETTITKRGYGFKAMSQMNETKNRLAVTGADKNGFAVLAGENDDADQINILLSNYEMQPSEMLSNDDAMRRGARAQGLPEEVIQANIPFIDGDDFYEPSGVAVWTMPKARVLTYNNNKGYNLTVNNIDYTTKYAMVEQYRLDANSNLDLVNTTVAEIKDGTITLSNEFTINKVDLLKIKPADADQAIDALEAAKQAAQEKAAEAAEAERIAEQKAAAAEKAAADAQAALEAAEKDAAEKIKAAEDAQKAAEEAQKVAEQKAAEAEKAAAALKAPGKVSLKTVKGAKKALTVKWAKVKDAKGYEIQIATNKKFTKNVQTITVKKGSAVSKKIKGLKAKTKYFVRVRATKSISGGVINGKWSAAKTGKTK